MPGSKSVELSQVEREFEETWPKDIQIGARLGQRRPFKIQGPPRESLKPNILSSHDNIINVN